MMIKDIIKTDNYLLLVSDKKIKEGEYYVSWEDYYSPPRYVIYVLSSDLNGDSPKKIIAHLPLNNSPELEGVPYLPKIVDEVEKLADDIPYQVGVSRDDQIQIWMDGYNKSKETNKYTDEDMLKLMYATIELLEKEDGEPLGIL